MRVLHTDRLILRNFLQSDLTNFIDIINNYNNILLSKHDHEWPNDKDNLTKILNWFCTQDDYLAIEINVINELIGFVNLSKKNENNVFDLGYVFHSKYQGHGYAYEACKSYIDYIVLHYQPLKIRSGTSKENVKSCKLLTKLGFIIIQESITFFQKNEMGIPIEFIGIKYEYRR